MSEQARLLTQSEIGRVNELLNALSENLFFHRNDSLAKGHGITLETSAYYDDAGDKLSDYVIRWSVEPTPGNLTVVYSPADLITNYSTKIPPGGAGVIGSPPTSLGVSYTATGPDGTAYSPGIPQLATNILTSYTESLTQDLELADAVLKAHALLNHGERNPSAHRGVSVTSEESYDSLGHLIGRKLVKIILGNQEYKIVADESIVGPPQGPRISVHPSNASARGESYPIGPAYFSVTVAGGDSPFTYQWQTYNGSAWVDLTNGVQTITGYGPGVTPQTATTNRLTLSQTYTTNENDWVLAAALRCKVTSSTGVTVYSNQAYFYTYDKTGC